jgi:CheY-like chemotaxis protein
MARILIVDDTSNIRKMVSLTLERDGHTVQVAADGAQGLEMFGDGSNFDLTLVDQQMPRVQGRELIREARKRDPLARLVMMTAFATSELANEVLQSGALDFLRKPFSTDTLRDAITVALEAPLEAFSPSNLADPDENVPLPAPGEEGFILPRLSYRFNGYAFWPLSNELDEAHPPGIEFGRAFQVRHPSGELTRCFVGVTSHIREQAVREVGEEIAQGDLFWEKLCGTALLNFLWEKTGAPPAVLPLYEMPKTSRPLPASLPWGARRV